MFSVFWEGTVQTKVLRTSAYAELPKREGASLPVLAPVRTRHFQQIQPSSIAEGTFEGKADTRAFECPT